MCENTMTFYAFVECSLKLKNNFFHLYIFIYELWYAVNTYKMQHKYVYDFISIGNLLGVLFVTK